jgi:protein CpxP
MTFVRKSISSLNSLVLAGLLATAGASAMAQGAPTAPPAGPPAAGKHEGHHHGDRVGRHDPAKMQAMIAKRQAEMKAKLKITPAQEGAWSAYTAAIQPPAGGMHGRPTPEQRAELDKLTTPERIDKMRAMRTQRMAEMNAVMDKRGDATKALYAALTPEQQKVFDAEQKNRRGHHGHGGHHGGPGPQKG